MKFFIFIIILILFWGCSDSESEKTDRCEGITCSNHGDCEVQNDVAVCICDDGYHEDGLTCVENSFDPCEWVTCSNHGDCEVQNDEAVCVCDDGYHEDGLTCVENNIENPCEGVTCSNHGDCEVQNSAAVCVCDDGYHEDGLTCVENNIENPCEGVTCSNHGDCEVQNDEAVCVCDYQTLSWNGDCIDKIDFFNSAISEESAEKLNFFWDSYDGPIRDQNRVLFVTRSQEGEIIKLSGDFNSWSSDPDPMLEVDFDTTFRYQIVEIDHNESIYYKFIGFDWYPDPNNIYFDFNENDNSIVYPLNSSRLAQFIHPSPELNNNDRVIYLYFPAEYFTTNKRFPVIYMQDGDNLFNGNPNAIYGTWGIKTNCDQAIEENMAEPVIVVGVTTVNRQSEYMHIYLPELDNEALLDTYTDYLINSLKPVIDQYLRTLPDKDNTAIAGSSLGGISSFFISWRNPDIFGKAGVFSPSSWIGEVEEFDPEVIETMRDLIQSTDIMPDIKIYIDSGDTSFDGTSTYYSDARGYTEYVRNMLVRNGWDLREEWLEDGETELIDYSENVDLSTVPTIYWSEDTPEGYSDYYDYLKPENNLLHIVGKDHMHNEPAWNNRFKAALIFLFPKN